MTTLCMCDLVETRADRDRRASSIAGSQARTPADAAGIGVDALVQQQRRGTSTAPRSPAAISGVARCGSSAALHGNGTH